MHYKRSRSSGNVLFIILLAVALFAALSYTVTSSTRGGGKSSSKEKGLSDIAVIQQYAASINSAISRLMISNGCDESKLNFYSDKFVYSSDYMNNSSPTDKSCNIFDSAGGNIIWQKPPVSSQVLGGVEYAFSANNNFNNIGLPACDRTELVMYIIIIEEMCISVNEKIGIFNTGGNPPQTATTNVPIIPNSNYRAFKGVFSCGSLLGAGTSAPEISGRMHGCFYHSAYNKYYYYEILMPR
ncbi:hypothetical protein [Sphingobium lignivorans]|uniref:Uncharacterized protein n=1 Tax=Sphingobium lignivorans TaxID=2735886 RepID=A0ABR6NEE1_9SPHN|nr:hypothetical protein [Sphingobium lignivorans]MBB5985645.1 hypothetical protein [Sphingobium lignivorans]